jgi:protein involved in sex pheromone biosynthesis
MIMEKVSHGRPITTAPADADLELSLYDEVEYHVLVFPADATAQVAAM